MFRYEYYSEDEVKYLRSRVDTANRNVASLEDGLATATRDEIDLEVAQETRRDKLKSVQKETDELREEGNRLQEQYSQKNIEYSDLIAKIAQNENQLADYNRQLSPLSDRVEAISKKIGELNNIISKPEPAANFERRCIHGHLNCPNLPNDQLSDTNASERAAFRRQVEAAKKEKESLSFEYASLSDQFNQIKHKVFELNIDLSNLQNQKLYSESTLSNLRSRIQSNRENYEIKYQEGQSLQSDSEFNDDLLYKAQSGLSRLQDAVDRARAELSLAQSQLSEAYSRPKGPIDAQAFSSSQAEKDAMLAEIARQELMREAIAMPSSYPAFGGAGGLSEADVERLAQMELAQEMSSVQPVLAFGSVATGIATVVGEARQEVRDLARGAQAVANTVKEAGREVEGFVTDIVHTVGDIWPSPAGLVVESMFNGPHGIMKEFYGEAPSHTGDLFVDNANRSPDE